MGVDIGFVQETKLTGGIYTRRSCGYTILASDAPSAHQGGVALIYREQHDLYEVEETKVWHPNLLSFQLVTGVDRYFVVGCYIPPSDLSVLEHIQTAWEQCPKGYKPMLIGDLNINLDVPRDERDETIAEQCDDWGLSDMSRHFHTRRGKRTKGRWTWRMRRGRRWVSSQPDYFMA